MVPSAFVVVDMLPLTSSGKVDRRALPSPDGHEMGTAYAPPRSEVEETLARIWCEVLGVERVGIHDNFFERGGHSLLILRVHQRVREELGVRDLRVVELFDHPTIATLAARVRREEPVAVSGPDAERLREGQGRLGLRRRLRGPSPPMEEGR
jgi:hypothetical protein